MSNDLDDLKKFEKKNKIDHDNRNIPAFKRPQSGSKNAIDRSYLKNWSESNDKFLMDSNKLAFHKDRLIEWAKGEKIVPLHIDMGISTTCNLACHYCYGVPQGRKGFLAREGKRQLMPLEVIKSVFNDSKEMGIRSIALIGEAENTLNPDLYPAVEYAREIDLDLSLATHGANFLEKHVESLMTSLQWIRINISAATPESYEHVHQRPWFDRVLKGTDLLIKGKNEQGYKNGNDNSTTIGFQMVLTGRNFDQIIPLAKLGKEVGVDYTVIKACSDTPDGRLETPHDEYIKMADIFKEAETYSSDNYKVIVRWNKLGNKGNKEYGICHGTRFIVALSGDGTLFPCGHWFAIEREKFAMGNVFDKSLAEIITSNQYWKVQEEIHKVDLRFCETNCRQHAVNQTLFDLSQKKEILNSVNSLETGSKDTLHKNFV